MNEGPNCANKVNAHMSLIRWLKKVRSDNANNLIPRKFGFPRAMGTSIHCEFAVYFKKTFCRRKIKSCDLCRTGLGKLQAQLLIGLAQIVDLHEKLRIRGGSTSNPAMSRMNLNCVDEAECHFLQ